jgi:hypothetical protein
MEWTETVVARLAEAKRAGVTGRLKDPPDVKWWERAG